MLQLGGVLVGSISSRSGTQRRRYGARRKSAAKLTSAGVPGGIRLPGRLISLLPCWRFKRRIVRHRWFPMVMTRAKKTAPQVDQAERRSPGRLSNQHSMIRRYLDWPLCRTDASG